MRRVPVALALATVCGALSAAAQHPAAPVASALAPASTGGLATIDRALAKLSTHKRLLVVGAHPDDEDNAVLALVARDMGGEAAYLSLSRGEGGQNLIGAELGVALGLIRTGELEAARGVEGGRQFFTRAYDFGYTRSLEETGRRWPREALLEDAVRVVRRFKPQVIVAVFPADSRAGHGQHQMAGVIARDAFELSGEPERFASLADLGLPPWQAQALYRRAWRNEEADMRFSLGGIDPLSGHSIAQIAAQSRSLHRSQDMGRVQAIGDRSGGLIWLAGGAGRQGRGPFAGIDTRLEAIASGLADPEARREVARRLAEVEALARRARRRLTPAEPSAVVPELARIVGLLRQVPDELMQPPRAAPHVEQLVAEKLAVAEAGLAAAAGVVVEAVADREEVPAGGRLGVSGMLWASGEPEVQAGTVQLLADAGWRVERRDGLEEAEENDIVSWEWEVEVPANAAPTFPYYLTRPLDGDLYDWSSVRQWTKGEPSAPPPLAVVFDLLIEGVPVRLEREVVHRYADQAAGEIRRPVRAVPGLGVSLTPRLTLWPLGSSAERKLEVTLVSHQAKPASGRLRVELPSSWPAVVERPFEIEAGGGRLVLSVPLTPPQDLAPGLFRGRVEAVLDSGRRFGASYPVVEYPHVRPRPLPVPAEFEIRALDLALPRLDRVGYVRGASDRVPELLTEVGMPVELLRADDLAAKDLLGYDAVVVGSRAYETEPALGRANERLLAYARGGGLVLVQYQQYQFVRGGFAPYPMTIARPHGRVTDENSPVRLLEPAHPVFARPNRITEADWRGWVQERGLYFADTWDEAYEPLLALRDPGQPEQRGALLVARLGRGRYVYTGLSFFRELPAGVPGAYRLLANLLALGEEE